MRNHIWMIEMLDLNSEMPVWLPISLPVTCFNRNAARQIIGILRHELERLPGYNVKFRIRKYVSVNG